jgi:hypothetical protein
VKVADGIGFKLLLCRLVAVDPGMILRLAQPLVDERHSLRSCVHAGISISAISIGCSQTTFRLPAYLIAGVFCVI